MKVKEGVAKNIKGHLLNLQSVPELTFAILEVKSP